MSDNLKDRLNYPTTKTCIILWGKCLTIYGTTILNVDLHLMVMKYLLDTWMQGILLHLVATLLL